MTALRPYQTQAIEAVFAELEQHRSTLVVLPTGAGKTVVFAKVAERFIQSTGKRVLVIAHREELLNQAIEKIHAWTGLKTDLERAEKFAERGAGLFGLSPVVVASVQTISRLKRLEAFGPDGFGLIIVDEAHHSTAQSYRDVLDYFAGAKVLGVTATPDRGDGKAMGAIYESAAFVYEIRDAIEQGFLCQVRQKSVKVESLDLSLVRTTAGDLNEGDLDAIMREERHIHEVARPTVDLAENRKTLIFGVTVAHAQDLARVINGYFDGRQVAAAIDGTMDRQTRAQILADFAKGRYQFLANCMIATEGFDLPEISCISMARPTKSRALYAQMVGRGTRIAEGKSDLLVLDFAGNSGKHALVCALDVLDGNMDLEVKERAKELIQKRGDLGVLEALDTAAHELAEEKRRAVAAQARTKTVDVDPFTIVGIHPNRERWGGAPATDKQIRLLKETYGIEASKMTKSEAYDLLDAIFTRSRKGLCSFKQARLLMKYGQNPDVSFEAASRVIGRIAANGWRLPPDLATSSAA